MAATGVYDRAIRKILTLRSIFLQECVTACTKIKYLCEYIHKWEHMKACQIRRGAKFGEKHMAHGSYRSIRQSYQKKYIEIHKLRLIFCEIASLPVRK